MISIDVIQRKFQRACVKEGGYIGLIFSEPGKKEASSVKIIGPNDNPADWLAVARDVGRGCKALFHLDKPQSLSLAGVNIRTMEAVCCKLANFAVAFTAGRLSLAEWKKDLSRGEIGLIKIMEKKGTMADISGKVIEAMAAV